MAAKLGHKHKMVGARTEPSQGSNTGSIPVSATSFVFPAVRLSLQL